MTLWQISRADTSAPYHWVDDCDTASEAPQDDLTHHAGNPSSKFSCFPNPATHRLTLSYTGEIENQTTFTLTNVAGKIVLESPVDAQTNSQQIDLNQIPPGIYLGTWKGRGMILESTPVIIKR